jgi:hypothetical protein
MPLRSSHAHFLNDPAAALVLIADHDREAHLPPANLQEVYDLTPAEAELLCGSFVATACNMSRTSCASAFRQCECICRTFSKRREHTVKRNSSGCSSHSKRAICRAEWKGQ